MEQVNCERFFDGFSKLPLAAEAYRILLQVIPPILKNEVPTDVGVELWKIGQPAKLFQLILQRLVAEQLEVTQLTGK